MRWRVRERVRVSILSVLLLLCASSLGAQSITFRPYIQPGDSGPLASKDQMLVAWQTDESSPSPTVYAVEFGKSLTHLAPAVVRSRVVDDYLSADSQFASLALPFKYGAHANYTAVLDNLDFATSYFYKVTGPGLPPNGFIASFHTRKKSGHFAFQVQGDEGYYPNIPGTSPPLVANYEARIINTMFNVASLALPGQPALPPPDLALNTGDNVYVAGAEDSYRDVWMPDWNSNVASNDRGAPYLRSIPLYIVAGNHDVGGTGATANLLADSGSTTPGSFGPGPFGGGVGGGDALAYFNNYYFPLNGPTDVDIQFRFNRDLSAPSNLLFSYSGVNYSSPRAIEAFRASTEVDSGKGVKRQVDHMSNYSFDYGNAHFVFLDANPHLFDNLLPGGPPSTPPAFPFPDYPTVLRDWLVNDLDASRQTWKIVVFHQPIFSSGNATVSNDQMRTIGRFLQDHGVNLVFNGHEHNYQRTLPIRALSNVTSAPVPGVPQVELDEHFDGVERTVPDGVLYFVEGAGGNRDFDDDLANPRGNGSSIDQDDAASGTTTRSVGGATYTFQKGAASFLDTSLSDDAMKTFIPNAGSGTKITARFKSKLFSFAHVVVNENALTLYQISEPLGTSTSATPQQPAPFGTDYRGTVLNDPLPDTVFDPVGKTVLSAPSTGQPALLDKITVTKLDISDSVEVKLSAPQKIELGKPIDLAFAFKNRTEHALNGTQVVFTLPEGVAFESTNAGTATVRGRDVVVSLGRTLPGQTFTVEMHGHVSKSPKTDSTLVFAGLLRSGTAMPVMAENQATKVRRADSDADSDR